MVYINKQKYIEYHTAFKQSEKYKKVLEQKNTLYCTDEEFKNKAKEYAKNRYKNDPEYRERKKAQSHLRYHQKKSNSESKEIFS
jgi:hypothetical protein